MVQTDGKWNKSGYIVEALPHRQYRVRIDGSGRVTLRNRRFLKPTSGSNASEASIPPQIGPAPPILQPRQLTQTAGDTSQTPPNSTQPQGSSEAPSASSTPASHPQGSTEAPPASSTAASSAPMKQPKALRELHDHNAPGLVSAEPSGTSRTRSGRL